jgi:8-hydroxy-5-deazaflavin:NADPH oxidoreductase
MVMERRRIAIIGGTGSLGRGLALRLSKSHDVSVGSRDESKGREIAEELSRTSGRLISGGLAEEVTRSCDCAIFAIPYTEDESFFAGFVEPLAGKIVISAIVPMRLEAGAFVYAKASGSAAEGLQSVLQKSRVAAALHTVPATLLARIERPLNADALVAADQRESFIAVASILRTIGLRPLYVGGLTTSRAIEGLTPLLLNIARLNGLRNPCLNIV